MEKSIRTVGRNNIPLCFWQYGGHVEASLSLAVTPIHADVEM